MPFGNKKKLQDEELRGHISALNGVCNIKEKELLGRPSIFIDKAHGMIQSASYHGTRVVVKHFGGSARLTKYRDLIGLHKCKCPNIATLIGAGPNLRREDLKYIVLEYAENSSLHALINSDVTYEMSHVLLWMAQGANATDYLHTFSQKPMLHRDIKPSNMLLFDYCRILKLSDFGIALFERAEQTTNQGTNAYIAPEVKRSGGVYGTEADIYSFCSSVWEVIARVPFKHKYRSIQGCPPLLCNLIRRGVDDDPSNRPSAESIANFADFLVSHISAKKPSECKLIFPTRQKSSDSEESSILTTTSPIQIASAKSSAATPRIIVEPASPSPLRHSDRLLSVDEPVVERPSEVASYRRSISCPFQVELIPGNDFIAPQQISANEADLKELRHQFHFKLESLLSECKLERSSHRRLYRERVIRYCDLSADKAKFCS